MRLQHALGAAGTPEHPAFGIDTDGDQSRYWFTSADGSRQEITGEVNAERQAVAAEVEVAITALIEPDVVLDNPEVFYLHRIKDARHLYFFVNPTHSSQSADVALRDDGSPLLWDTSTGEERPIAPICWEEGTTRFRLELPPVGSAFVVIGDTVVPRIADTNVVIDAVGADGITGYARGGEGFVTLEHDGLVHRLVADPGAASEPLVLDGGWDFHTEDANALVIGRWLATPEQHGTDTDTYAAPEVETTDWLPMVPGAWSYQLPTEPENPYPVNVWYRLSFHIRDVPGRLNLLVDGFAGSGWKLYVNGAPSLAEPVRSDVDSQMKAIDITDLVRPGENLLAIRLTVTGATDGLLDLVKLTGDFSLQRRNDNGEFSLAAPVTVMQPTSWTEQGYPFYSGRATYRHRFDVPADFADQRIELDVAMVDDVVEVTVNGRAAGVRLWEPYRIDISPFLAPGQNELELRVANTLINLLEAVPRSSGLGGPPRVVPYRRYRFEIPG